MLDPTFTYGYVPMWLGKPKNEDHELVRLWRTAHANLNIRSFISQEFRFEVEFAIMMLLLTHVLRQNEYRADFEGAKATSPEDLIAVFESLDSVCGKDDGSDTHPPLRARIKRLLRLIDSDLRYE